MSVDAARVLATFGIVWVHVSESQGLSYGAASLGRFGTSFYVIVAALFATRAVIRSPGQRFSAELYKKTQRLLRPFVIWSLVYGLLYGLRALREGHSFKGLTHWWGPFAGTAVHLWFLPFVFFWGVVAVVLVPRLLTIRARSILIFGGLGSFALYFVSYRWIFFSVDRPWLWSFHLHRLDRWIVEVPLFVTALLTCVYFYRLSEAQRGKLREKQGVIGALSLLLFALMEYLYAAHVDVIRAATESEGRFMANLAGAALFFIFLAKNDSLLARLLSPLGRYTYLAFLAHMLVVEAIRSPVKALDGYGEIWLAFTCTLFVFALSLGISALVQKLRFLAWLRA